MLRPRSLAVLAGLAGLALGLVGLDGSGAAAYLRVRGLTRAVPAFDRELAEHLITDAPETWDAYCRRVGPHPLMLGVSALYRSLMDRPYGEFASERLSVERLQLRMAEALERLYDYPPCAVYARLALAMPAEHDFQLHQLNRSYTQALADSSITASERLARLDALIARADSLRDPYQAMSIQTAAAEIELQVGRSDRHRARLVRALAEAKRLRDDYLACQILGTQAVQHYMNDDPDSAQLCLADGIARARRHHFPEQASRLVLFAARHAALEGRLALAADRYELAGQFADEFGSGQVRLRLTLDYAHFLSELGCWDLAQQVLNTLPPLQREFPTSLESAEATKYRFNEDLIRARVAFATGHADDGQRLLAQWVRNMPLWNRRIGLSEALGEWSWGLQHCGRDAEALAVCERGLVHADTAHVPEMQDGLALRRVRLFEGLGRLAEARSALRDAERRMGGPRNPPGPYEIALEIARMRVACHDGNVVAGRRLARLAFEQLAESAGSSNPQSAARAQDFQGLSLRDAVHELAGLSPAAGYGFELAWRSLARRRAVGRPSREPDPVPDPLAEAHYGGPGVHLVYHFVGNSLLRWTATSSGVRLDTIPLPAQRCLAAVRTAVTLLQTEATARGTWLGPRSQEALEPLARALLPQPVLEHAGRFPLVEISPDGPLAALPFAALPVHDSLGSAPLAARVDVDELRSWDFAPSVVGGPTLIVSNPALEPDVQRRYAWAGPLAGTDAESRAARSRWPDAIVLRGEAATKRAFVDRAVGASNIYVAAHLVRDPGAPFLGFVPLAGPGGFSPTGSFLERADVRALDLSACRLAVLAACSSGAPDRIALEPGASLGDAFLEAGARSVVQCYWDVRDDETRLFMQRFLRIDRGLHDPVRSLNRARREAMAEAGGVPARVWAAWSVALTRPRAGGAPRTSLAMASRRLAPQSVRR